LISLLLISASGCASNEKIGIQAPVQQKKYDTAIAQGEELLAQNPAHGDTHFFVGAAYVGKDQELATETAWYGDSSAVYLEKAFKHLTRAKQLAPARWAQSVETNIVSMFARHNNRGIIASTNGDHATAALEYRLATVANPQDHRGYYARAGALWGLAREARASGDEDDFLRLTSTIIENLDHVLELDLPDQDTRINVHQTKGDVHYMRQELGLAQEAYQRALRLSPENYNLMLTVAERFYNDKSYEGAVAYFQDALHVRERLGLIDESDAAIYSAVGHAFSQLNRTEEAISAYEKALELKPHDAVIHLRLIRLRNEKDESQQR
jgi:tetratricopeptide (TPR) repeat protein